jgi:signal transduction histidine kinase
MGSHGGTLSVTSTPQQGVTIVASLPRQLNVQTT